MQIHANAHITSTRNMRFGRINTFLIALLFTAIPCWAQYVAVPFTKASGGPTLSNAGTAVDNGSGGSLTLMASLGAASSSGSTPCVAFSIDNGSATITFSDSASQTAYTLETDAPYGIQDIACELSSASGITSITITSSVSQHMRAVAFQANGLTGHFDRKGVAGSGSSAYSVASGTLHQSVELLIVGLAVDSGLQLQPTPSTGPSTILSDTGGTQEGFSVIWGTSSSTSSVTASGTAVHNPQSQLITAWY